MVEKLAEIKLQYSYEQMLKMLGPDIKKCNAITKMVVALSGKKRRYAVVQITADGIGAEKVLREYEKTQMVNCREHDQVNMNACPDHYVLRATGENSLEVIETCGNNPFISQFFIRYGDETGLTVPRDHEYPYQSAGIAVFPDGKIQGGVRHQFKDTETGFTAKLTVEFPGKTPAATILQHQMHLASEFSYWFQWVLDNRND